MSIDSGSEVMIGSVCAITSEIGFNISLGTTTFTAGSTDYEDQR